jgi:hypothetical protein
MSKVDLAYYRFVEEARRRLQEIIKNTQNE